MRISIMSAAVAALVLAACGTGQPPDDRPRVVATTTQVGSILEELGGDDIQLTVLLPAGVEAHDFELTPTAAAAVEDADLIVRSGAGLESWLDDALETIGGDSPIADLSQGVELRTPAAGSGHHHEGEEHEGEGEEHEGEGEEHEGEVDPHYWLSGPNAIRMVENARDALVDTVPAAEAAIADRAEVLLARLDAADAEVRRLIGEVPESQRGIVTNHDALGYFADEYGLRVVASVFPSLDVAAEPNPSELATLVDTIRRNGVVAIFSETGVNPDVAQAIAAETDATVIEETLYVDSLGEEGSGVETLDAMLVHNARVIRDALVAGG